MSQEENCRKCGEGWESHTLTHDSRGNFGSVCGRRKREGIDPFMQLWRDHAGLEELLEKTRTDNASALAKLKSEHKTEIDGRQKQLDDLKAAVQSAEARVRGFDNAMKAELDRLRENLEKAHKADLEARLKAMNTAHEEARAKWVQALDDLQSQYNALSKRLDAANAQATTDAAHVARLNASLTAAELGFVTERHAFEQRHQELLNTNAAVNKARAQAEEARDEAKAAQVEAERKLRHVHDAEKMAKDDAKRAEEEIKTLKATLWRYENLHGPLPAEEAVVDEPKVVPDATPEQPKAPSDEPAPVEVVAVPQDEHPADDEDFSDHGTDPSIEIGSIGSMIVEHDDHCDDGDDAPQCASYGGCPNHPTSYIEIELDDGGPGRMYVCDKHQGDRTGLLMTLKEQYKIDTNGPEDLNGRFIPINNEQTEQEEPHVH